MDATSGCSAYMIAASCLSAIGAGSIIVDILSNRNRRRTMYAHVILYVAVSCLFNGVGTMMGEPRDGSTECWFMGIDTNIFSLSAMLWTAYLTYTLHAISRASDSMHMPTKSSLLRVHCVCWGIPIAVTLLPLTSFTYGSPEKYGWCFLVDRGRQEPMLLFFWILVSYYVWVWSSLILSMFYLLAAAKVLVRNCHSERAIRAAKKALFRLRLFCGVILLSWLPNTVLEMVFFFRSVPNGDYVLPLRCFGATMACLQGAFTASVYWFTSSSSSTKIDNYDDKPQVHISDYVTSDTASRTRQSCEGKMSESTLPQQAQVASAQQALDV